MTNSENIKDTNILLRRMVYGLTLFKITLSEAVLVLH